MISLRKLLFLLCGVFFLNGSLAHAQTVWTNRFSGPSNGPDSPSYIVTDNVGFVYVAGNTSAGVNLYDIVLIKYEPDGSRSESWPDVGYGPGVRLFDAFPGAIDQSKGLAVDDAGNVYLLSMALHITSGLKAVVAKYDSTGTLQWTNVTNVGQTSLVEMRVDAAGNMYLLINAQIWNYDGSGAYIKKFNSQGEPSTSWPNQGYGVGVRRFIAYGRTLEIGSDGSVTIVGSAVDPVAVTIPLNRIAIWKYSATGQFMWSNTNAPTSNTYDLAFKLTVDEVGNSYVAGNTSPVAGGSRDYLLLKYDANGLFSSSWPDNGNGVGVRLYNHPLGTNDIATAMSLDHSGNVIISGLSQRTNGVDLVTVKYDGAGNLFTGWPNQGAGPGVRILPTMVVNTNMAMGVDGGGNVIVTMVNAALFGHIRTTEYSPNGTAKLLGTFDGVFGRDEPKGLALDQLGNVFITGATPGTSSTDTDIVTLGYYRNGAPVANAGDDQTVAVQENCEASVTLNGSGSTDPDGDALTYVWSGSFGSVTGAVATVTMERGTQIVTLTVSDKFKTTATDTVTITVADQTPPVVTVPTDYTVNAGADGMGAVPSVLADVLAADNCTPSGSLNKFQSPFSGTLLPAGDHTITVTVSDASGNVTTKTTTLHIVDVTAPTIAATGSVTVSAGSDGLAAVPDVSASVVVADNVTPVEQLVITQSPVIGASIGLGTYAITVTVSDAAGNTASTVVSLSVVDTSAPVFVSLTATPDVLSPANGKLLPVMLSAVVVDNTDASPVTRIVSVTSNESIVAPGPRVKNPDYEITGDMTLNLRAKSSTSAGRTYYVTVSSVDVFGNEAFSTIEIDVDSSSTGGGGGGKGGGGKGGKN